MSRLGFGRTLIRRGNGPPCSNPVGRRGPDLWKGNPDAKKLGSKSLGDGTGDDVSILVLNTRSYPRYAMILELLVISECIRQLPYLISMVRSYTVRGGLLLILYIIIQRPSLDEELPRSLPWKASQTHLRIPLISRP